MRNYKFMHCNEKLYSSTIVQFHKSTVLKLGIVDEIWSRHCLFWRLSGDPDVSVPCYHVLRCEWDQ